MKLTGESKLLLGIIVATVSIIAVASFLFTKPAPVYSREELIPKNTHTTGNPQARAYLVEFSDFQCPACKAAKPYVDKVVTTYKDKLLFAYRYFPLSQHPFGQKSAQAAEIAGTQGKFWDMYQVLFDKQDSFSDDLFPTLASQLGLNEAMFKDDLAKGTYSQRVTADQSDGIRFGVSSTPTFFLNGKKLELTSFSDIQTAVENALKE